MGAEFNGFEKPARSLSNPRVKRAKASRVLCRAVIQLLYEREREREKERQKTLNVLRAHGDQGGSRRFFLWRSTLLSAASMRPVHFSWDNFFCRAAGLLSDAYHVDAYTTRGRKGERETSNGESMWACSKMLRTAPEYTCRFTDSWSINFTRSHAKLHRMMQRRTRRRDWIAHRWN